MKVESGIIIGRMNPPHIGHVELIKKSLQENDSTYVYIGIKKQSDERNPFSFEEIKIFLLLIFSKEVQESILKIDFIGDVDTDREWAENIFEKIKSSVQ
jgi:nicotinamide-nucleotide adenylyltransferase